MATFICPLRRNCLKMISSFHYKCILPPRRSESTNHVISNPMKRKSSDGLPDLPNKLDPFSVVSDVDFIDSITPGWKQSFNLAAYVNKSKTLQTFLSMGVSLFDIESINPRHANYLLGLDFTRDCASHIRFLVDNGLKEDKLGWFISENPVIFKENLGDLQVRINYLQSKNFTKGMISQMLNRSALIWSQSTKTMDHKLGLLQVEFQLPGPFVRKIVAQYPNSILLPHGQIYIVIDVIISKR